MAAEQRTDPGNCRSVLFDISISTFILKKERKEKGKMLLFKSLVEKSATLQWFIFHIPNSDLMLLHLTGTSMEARRQDGAHKYTKPFLFYVCVTQKL